jgi:hypothetical protein
MGQERLTARYAAVRLVVCQYCPPVPRGRSKSRARHLSRIGCSQHSRSFEVHSDARRCAVPPSAGYGTRRFLKFKLNFQNFLTVFGVRDRTRERSVSCSQLSRDPRSVGGQPTLRSTGDAFSSRCSQRAPSRDLPRAPSPVASTQPSFGTRASRCRRSAVARFH